MKKPKQVKIRTFKFRPVADLKAILRRAPEDRALRMNWQPRFPNFHEFNKRPANECFLGKMSMLVHHHTCHGVEGKRPRWNNANIRFEKRFPVRSSTKYANTFSAHRFL